MKNTYWLALIGECGEEVSRCRQPTHREVEAGTEYKFTNLRGRPTHYAVYTKRKGGRIKGTPGAISDGWSGGDFTVVFQHGPMVILFD